MKDFGMYLIKTIILFTVVISVTNAVPADYEGITFFGSLILGLYIANKTATYGSVFNGWKRVEFDANDGMDSNYISDSDDDFVNDNGDWTRS